MSEAVAPETTTTGTEETATPPAAERTPEEDARERFQRFFATADKDKPATDEKPTDTEEAAADESPPVEPPKEEKPKAPDAEKLELNLARATRDVKRLTTENVAEKRARADAESRLAEATQKLESITAKLKANPLKGMEELAGQPLKDILDRAAKGEFDIEDPYAKLPPDVREAIDFAKEQKAERAAQAAAAKEETARQSDIAVAREYLTENADDYAFLDADAAEWIADEARAAFKKTGQMPDLAALAKSANDGLLKTMEAMLVANAKLRKSALQVPSIRAALVSELGIDKPQPKPTSSKAPPGRPNLATAQAEVVSRPNQQKNGTEERDEILKNLRAFQARESA